MKKYNKQIKALSLFQIAIISLALLAALQNTASAETKHNETPAPVIVKYVIDGDTIVVELYGRVEKVRIIGFDTPEREQPFYRKAKQFTKDFLKGSSVEIEICSSERRDKYDRLLAWVYSDGASLGEAILKAGFAKTLAIPPCGLRFGALYKKLEQNAKKKGLNIWKK